MEPKNPPNWKGQSSSKPPILGFKMLKSIPKLPTFYGPKEFWETRGSKRSQNRNHLKARVRYFLPHQFRGATKKTQPNIHQTVAICAGNQNFTQKPQENVQTPWMVCVQIWCVAMCIYCIQTWLYEWNHWKSSILIHHQFLVESLLIVNDDKSFLDTFILGCSWPSIR